eukprot:365126-Chlamydomonas_euryale.AAC.11
MLLLSGALVSRRPGVREQHARHGTLQVLWKVVRCAPHLRAWIAREPRAAQRQLGLDLHVRRVDALKGREHRCGPGGAGGVAAVGRSVHVGFTRRGCDPPIALPACMANHVPSWGRHALVECHAPRVACHAPPFGACRGRPCPSPPGDACRALHAGAPACASGRACGSSACMPRPGAIGDASVARGTADTLAGPHVLPMAAGLAVFSCMPAAPVATRVPGRAGR